MFHLSQLTSHCLSIVFLMFCDCQCSIALPNSAVSWFAVCDCGYSRPYSFIVLDIIYIFKKVIYTGSDQTAWMLALVGAFVVSIQQSQVVSQ